MSYAIPRHTGQRLTAKPPHRGRSPLATPGRGTPEGVTVVPPVKDVCVGVRLLPRVGHGVVHVFFQSTAGENDLTPKQFFQLKHIVYK